MLRTTAILTTLALTAPALAAEAGSADEPLRIAVVDIARLIDESPHAQVITGDLREEFAPIERQLSAMQQELQAMDERLRNEGEFMTETERWELNRDIAALDRQLQRRNTEYLEDVNLRRNEELARLQQIVVEAVRGYAHEQGFDLVLGDAIVYASDRSEITEQVMLRLQQEFRQATDPAGGN